MPRLPWERQNNSRCMTALSTLTLSQTSSFCCTSATAPLQRATAGVPVTGATLMSKLRALTAILATTITLAPLALAQSASSIPVEVTIDAAAPTTPLPHFWEKTFGSGRAILSLRDSYRTDLTTVKEATDFESVRFHAIFHDEVGLYDPDRKTIEFAQTAGKSGTASQDTSAYNFSYVDQIYDGVLARHVRPFVEMSFMPKKMA